MSSTNRGLRRTRRSQRAISASPPVCRLARHVRRRSKRRPRRPGRHRRDRPRCSRRSSARAASRQLGLDRRELKRCAAFGREGTVGRTCDPDRLLIDGGRIIAHHHVPGTARDVVIEIRRRRDGRRRAVAGLLPSRLCPAVGRAWPGPACRSGARLRDPERRTCERLVEDQCGRPACCSGWAEARRERPLVGELDDVERTSGVVQLAGTDAEAMLAAQRPQNAARFSGRLAKGYISGAA